MKMADIKVGESYAVKDHSSNWGTVYRIFVLKVKVRRWVTVAWGTGNLSQRADGVQGRIFHEDGEPVTVYWGGARRPTSDDLVRITKYQPKCANDHSIDLGVFNVQATKVFMLWSDYEIQQAKDAEAVKSLQDHQAALKVKLLLQISELPAQFQKLFGVRDKGYENHPNYTIVYADTAAKLMAAIQGKVVNDVAG